MCICLLVHVVTRSKRSSSQIDILKNKLANLQGLLQQIEKGEEQAIKTTLPPTVKPESINKAKESAMVTSKTTDSDKSDDSLTSDEVAVLMSINKAKESAMVTSKTIDSDKSDDNLTSDEVAVLMVSRSTRPRNQQWLHPRPLTVISLTIV
ncbi:uncharacterized protein LOC134718100 [Mytilus trossulus]|uniref:uncharacterized protein LOC134718100 n=1 Tax=Mytilus trossulus TaxID=6551 RepID=UPI003006276F